MRRVYVALDLEATGLDRQRDAIIEIGAVKFRGQEVLDTWTSLVNPHRPIPLRVTQLTGITQEEVERAPDIHSLLDPLQRFVGACPIVGHSISIDLEFLRRYGLFLDNPLIDTFELAGILMPHAARYSLGTLADELDIEFPIRHRALADAMASKELFLALLERAKRLPLGVIREINRLAEKTDWPLRYVFREVEREQTHSAFASSIGQQLMAKGVLGEEGLMGPLFPERERKRPLRPAPERKLLDVDALTAMLEEGGLFAEHFPGYEYRPQQVEMLRAVAEAFNRGEHLLVEAGTGTGKSIAYLLPAIHFAVQNGEHVVISTNTINLQDQLFNKDIPDLKRILPFEFEAVVLKGRSNYICLRKLAAFRHKAHLSPDEMQVLAKVLVWLPSTMTGDREELFLPSARERAIWGELCAESESCLPERCRYFREGMCFFYRARHRAESAHLIVVNHALLLSDVAVENRVLPEYRYLIVDEAHHLEDATTQQLSFEVNCQSIDRLLSGLSQTPALGAIAHGHNQQRTMAPSGRYSGFLASLLARCRPALPDEEMRRRLERHVERLQQKTETARRRLYEFFNALDTFVGEYRQEVGPYDQRIRLTEGLRTQPAWDRVAIAWDNLSLPLLELGKGLEELAGGMEELTDYEIPGVEEMLQELIGYSHRVSELWGQMNALIAEPSPKGIYWLSVGAQDGSISLHAAPLHVGDLVERYLFAPKECVVLTSATLCVGGNFDYIRERLNAWDASELNVGSPFDYANSTLLYLPTDIPEPGQPYYQKTVEKTLIELCRATRGRTMVLFTSYNQLHNTFHAIAPPLEKEGIIVYAQGTGTSRQQLLENFKTTEKAVLLGTSSFWEGVDVVGEALSCLVIARLPFSVPTDPIFAARSETFDDPFGEYAVPQAILRFRQGFGRLIRSKTDRGVVVVLDKRLLTKFYGRAFLDSLPECTVMRASLAELPRLAARWIDGGQRMENG